MDGKEEIEKIEAGALNFADSLHDRSSDKWDKAYDTFIAEHGKWFYEAYKLNPYQIPGLRKAYYEGYTAAQTRIGELEGELKKSDKFMKSMSDKMEADHLQLLEQQIASDAWDAAVNYTWNEYYGPVPNPAPNKTQYLASLTGAKQTDQETIKQLVDFIDTNQKKEGTI